MKKLQLKKEIIESLNKSTVKGGVDPDTPLISLWICPGDGTSGICTTGCPSRDCPADPRTNGDMISCRDYSNACDGEGSGFDRLTIYEID